MLGTLLIFLIIFIPAGWVLWKLLRFTRNTIGDNSPMKVQRIYRTTAQSFFFRFEYIIVIMSLLLGGAMIYAVFTARFSVSYPEVARGVLLVMSIVMLGVGVLIPLVDLNHWPHARGVVIATYPDEHALEIDLPHTSLRLRDGDISKISFYQNNAKVQLGFVQFHLAGGETFVLPYKTEGLWVACEYFKGIPVERFVHHIPFINSALRSAQPVTEGNSERFGWVPLTFSLAIGICLLVMTYMIYLDDKWQDEMSAVAPVVCMKIQYAERGAGTVKYPDKIFAEYRGKSYHFDMGRKYFRSLAGVDTIAVHFDEATGRAFLPSSGRVKHYLFLYLLTAGGGMIAIVGSIWEFRKRWRGQGAVTVVQAPLSHEV